MNGSRNFLLAMVVASAFGANPAPARAESAGASADELFAEGRAAMANHDYATARVRFESSYRVDPGVGTILNLAVCEEKLGLLNAALEHLSIGLVRAAEDDHRRPAIQARIDELRLRVPHLTLRTAKPLPPGVRVMLDEKPVEAAVFGTALPLDPGVHVITTVGLHGPLNSHRLELAERQAAEWWVEVPVSKSHEIARSEPAREPAQSRGPAAYWVGAVGLAGLALGIVAGAEVLHFKDTMSQHCDNRGCDPAGMDAASAGQTWSWVGTIATGVGVVGLGTAAWLSFGARPTTASGAEVTVHGRF